MREPEQCGETFRESQGESSLSGLCATWHIVETWGAIVRNSKVWSLVDSSEAQALAEADKKKEGSTDEFRR